MLKSKIHCVLVLAVLFGFSLSLQGQTIPAASAELEAKLIGVLQSGAPHQEFWKRDIGAIVEGEHNMCFFKHDHEALRRGRRPNPDPLGKYFGWKRFAPVRFGTSREGPTSFNIE